MVIGMALSLREYIRGWFGLCDSWTGNGEHSRDAERVREREMGGSLFTYWKVQGERARDDRCRVPRVVRVDSLVLAGCGLLALEAVVLDKVDNLE